MAVFLFFIFSLICTPTFALGFPDDAQVIALLESYSIKSYEGPFFDYFWNELSSNRELIQALEAHDLVSAKDTISKCLHFEYTYALGHPEYNARYLVGMMSYIEHFEAPGSNEYQLLGRRINEGILAHPSEFTGPISHDTLDRINWQVFWEQLKAMTPIKRANLFVKTLIQDPKNETFESLSGVYLDAVAEDPDVYFDDLLEILKQDWRHWKVRGLEKKIFDFLETALAKSAGSLNAGHLDRLHEALKHSQPEVSVYAEAILAKVSYSKRRLLWIHMNGESIEEVFGDLHLSLEDHPGNPLSAAIERLLEYEATLSEASYQPIGFVIFDQLLRENPGLAHRWTERFYEHEFFPNLFAAAHASDQALLDRLFAEYLAAPHPGLAQKIEGLLEKPILAMNDQNRDLRFFNRHYVQMKRMLDEHSVVFSKLEFLRMTDAAVARIPVDSPLIQIQAIGRLYENSPDFRRVALHFLSNIFGEESDEFIRELFGNESLRILLGYVALDDLFAADPSVGKGIAENFLNALESASKSVLSGRRITDVWGMDLVQTMRLANLMIAYATKLDVEEPMLMGWLKGALTFYTEILDATPKLVAPAVVEIWHRALVDWISYQEHDRLPFKFLLDEEMTNFRAALEKDRLMQMTWLVGRVGAKFKFLDPDPIHRIANFYSSKHCNLLTTYLPIPPEQLN